MGDGKNYSSAREKGEKRRGDEMPSSGPEEHGQALNPEGHTRLGMKVNNHPSTSKKGKAISYPSFSERLWGSRVKWPSSQIT